MSNYVKFDKYDRRGAYHDAEMKMKKSEYKDHVHEVVRLIGPVANQTILDVGAGEGTIMDHIWAENKGAQAPKVVFGIDPERRACQLAVERCRPVLNMTVGQAAHYFMPETFDKVLLLDVIEHLPQPHLALAEIRDMLKTGGKLIVATPFPKHPTPRHHYEEFTPTDLHMALERAGFKKIEMRNNINLRPGERHYQICEK